MFDWNNINYNAVFFLSNKCLSDCLKSFLFYSKYMYTCKHTKTVTQRMLSFGNVDFITKNS